MASTAIAAAFFLPPTSPRCYFDCYFLLHFSAFPYTILLLLDDLSVGGHLLHTRVVMTVYFTTIFEGYHVKIKLLKKDHNSKFPAKTL